MQHLAAGAANAGRTIDDIDRPQLVVCSVDDDRQAALDGARLLVTQYLGQQPHIMKASGVPQELLDEIGKVLTWPATHDQVVAASKLVPDDDRADDLRGRHSRRGPRQGRRVRGRWMHLPDPLPTRTRCPVHDRHVHLTAPTRPALIGSISSGLWAL